MNQDLRSAIGNRHWIALCLGLVALGLCLLGWFLDPRQFFIAYLFGELVWLGVALGSMGFLMMHYLTGGMWGWPTRRMLEAASKTLPLLGLTFIPIFFGLHYLYPWAMPVQVAADQVLQHKHPYLSPFWFVVKACIFFAIWSVIAVLLNRWSRQQDSTHDVAPLIRIRKWSGPGLVLYPLTVTFTYVDWIMSLEPDWYSTMFPILICIGQMLSGLTFVILLLFWLGPRSSLSAVTGKENFHHLGSLVFAFTMMWAYLAFGQLLIIWSGDLPHEISWYLHRVAGSWHAVVAFLVLFHFFGPFLILLSRQVKRSRRALAIIAGVVFAAHIVDVWWMIEPSFYQHGIHISWQNFTALLGIGGVWLFFFTRNLESKSLVPLNDPRFALAITA